MNDINKEGDYQDELAERLKNALRPYSDNILGLIRHTYMDARQQDLMNDINKEGDYNDKLAERLKNALQGFNNEKGGWQ